MTPPRPQLETAGDSQELETLIRARYPILSIASWEEERVERALQEIAQRRGTGFCVTGGSLCSNCG